MSALLVVLNARLLLVSCVPLIVTASVVTVGVTTGAILQQGTVRTHCLHYIVPLYMYL